MKLGLGTAQFGMNYGITNRSGKTSPDEVGRILEVANRAGVSMLDTAASYGTSEAELGRHLARYPNFRVVTKIPAFRRTAIGEEEAGLLHAQFAESLGRLKRRSTYGVLLHDAKDLLAPGGGCLFDAMAELKESGSVERIGVSVYTADEIDAVCRRFPVDLVQLPVSVLDQRLIESGHLRFLKDRGIEVHARSIFLQGLILIDPDELLPYFRPVRERLLLFRAMLSDSEVSGIEAALGFVLGVPEIDCVIAGVCDVRQLEEVLSAALSNHDWKMDFKAVACQDERILNPALWPRH